MSKRTAHQPTPVEEAAIYAQSAERQLQRIYDRHRTTPHEEAPHGGIYDCRDCGSLRETLRDITRAAKLLA